MLKERDQVDGNGEVKNRRRIWKLSAKAVSIMGTVVASEVEDVDAAEAASEVADTVAMGSQVEVAFVVDVEIPRSPSHSLFRER